MSKNFGYCLGRYFDVDLVFYGDFYMIWDSSIRLTVYRFDWQGTKGFCSSYLYDWTFYYLCRLFLLDTELIICWVV